MGDASVYLTYKQTSIESIIHMSLCVYHTVSLSQLSRQLHNHDEFTLRIIDHASPSHPYSNLLYKEGIGCS